MNHQPSDSPAGHYHTTGYAIAGMGVLAAAMFVATLLVDVDLGFIDQRGILGISIAFATVGWVMTRVRDTE